MALFRFHQQSYVDDTLVEKGQSKNVGKHHKPGPHWEPLDDDAKAMVARTGVEFTGEVPDVLSALLPLYEDATTKANAQGQALSKEDLTAAFKSALNDVLNPEMKKAEFDAAVRTQVEAVLAEIAKKRKAQAGAQAEPPGKEKAD